MYAVLQSGQAQRTRGALRGNDPIPGCGRWPCPGDATDPMKGHGYPVSWSSRDTVTAMKRILALLLVVLSPPAALACSCMPPGTPAEQKAESARVFLGRVQQLELIDVSEPGGKPVVVSNAGERFGRLPPMDVPILRYKRVRLLVQETFKGTPVPQLTVETGLWDGDCGVPFQPGQAYVVYARDEAGALTTNTCSSTGLASSAVSPLSQL